MQLLISSDKKSSFELLLLIFLYNFENIQGNIVSFHSLKESDRLDVLQKKFQRQPIAFIQTSTKSDSLETFLITSCRCLIIFTYSERRIKTKANKFSSRLSALKELPSETWKSSKKSSRPTQSASQSVTAAQSSCTINLPAVDDNKSIQLLIIKIISLLIKFNVSRYSFVPACLWS